MKVRMKVDVSGSRNGRPWPGRGSTLDLPDDEGASMCEAGLCTPVAEGHAETEKAVPPADDEQRTTVTTDSAPAVAQKAAQDNKPAPAAKKAAAKKAPARKTTE